MKNDTEKLLSECNAGIKMGTRSIERVLPHVKDDGLRAALEATKNTHSALGDATHAALLNKGYETKPPHAIASIMSDAKICVKLLAHESDKTVADLMTDGCNMGVKSLARYLNQYKGADTHAKSIARQLIHSEESLAKELRRFL